MRGTILCILLLCFLTYLFAVPAATLRTIELETKEVTGADVRASPVNAHKTAELEGATGSGLTPFASICPDGQYISFIADVEGDQVFLLDLRTGSRRQLTWGPGESGDSAIISPDCKQVVYDAWASEHPELRLIGTDGSRPRILFGAGSLLLLQPHAWSGDGKYILFDLVREDLTYQIGLVAIADGSVRIIATRTLKTLNGRKPWARLALSPDGRYVAYEYPPQGDAHQRRILLLSANGQQERVLVREASDYRLLGWAPDGRSILYTSVRDGKWNVWAVEVEGGAPKGPHKLVVADVGKIRNGLGFTREGSFYYAAPAAGNDLYITSLSPEQTRLEAPEKVATRLADESSPAWSPDGRRLAYAYGFGHRLDLFRVAIRSASTGDERQYALETLVRFGGHSFQPQWSPDGRSLLAVGRDPRYSGPGRDSQGIYRIDLASGKTEPIVRTEQNCWWDCMEWAGWASDGWIIFVRWLPAPRHIVALDPTTGREVEIYRPASAANISRLAVSPDGKQLAFVWRDNHSGESALKLVSMRGGEARDLVTATKPVTISCPAWTPDSRQIIYATETTGAEGRLQFWQVSAHKGEPQNLGLAMPGVQCQGLSVHSDGRRIAFTAGTPPRSEVWVLKDFLPALKTTK